MLRKKLSSLVVVVLLFHFSVIAHAAEVEGRWSDPFACDGAQNIREESHFGIVNGKLTCCIPYRDAFAVRGLWAPPFVSSNFDLKVRVMGQAVATDRYQWHPYRVDRAGVIQGMVVKTATLLVYGSRAGLIEISLTNVTKQPRDVPLTVNAAGTLDRSERWEFDTPVSATRTTRTIADGSLRLEQGKLAVVVRGDRAIRWNQEKACGEATVSIPPSGQATLFVAFAIGPAAEAGAACKAIADAPERAMTDCATLYARRVHELFQRLPTLESSHPALVRLYNRSLVHLLMNRWDVPEFVLHPYYGTGSVGGGCVCEYLWNFAENWEILPLYDADATRRTSRSSCRSI